MGPVEEGGRRRERNGVIGLHLIIDDRFHRLEAVIPMAKRHRIRGDTPLIAENAGQTADLNPRPAVSLTSTKVLGDAVIRDDELFATWHTHGSPGLGDDPEELRNFKRIGRTDEVAGWKQYTSSVEIETDEFGRAYAACGINCVWETMRSYYIDYVDLSFTPLLE